MTLRFPRSLNTDLVVPEKARPSFGRSSMRGSIARGFTILEVCIAMSIGLIVLGVAVLTITSVQDENQLREASSNIETTVRDALFEAMASQRPVRLALDGAFGGSGQVMVKRYGESKFRPAARGEFWEFSPSGICEPVSVRVMHSLGQIELTFDPLTGMARDRSIIVNG